MENYKNTPILNGLLFDKLRLGKEAEKTYSNTSFFLEKLFSVKDTLKGRIEYYFNRIDSGEMTWDELKNSEVGGEFSAYINKGRDCGLIGKEESVEDYFKRWKKEQPSQTHNSFRQSNPGAGSGFYNGANRGRYRYDFETNVRVDNKEPTLGDLWNYVVKPAGPYYGGAVAGSNLINSLYWKKKLKDTEANINNRKTPINYNYKTRLKDVDPKNTGSLVAAVDSLGQGGNVGLRAGTKAALIADLEGKSDKDIQAKALKAAAKTGALAGFLDAAAIGYGLSNNRPSDKLSCALGFGAGGAMLGLIGSTNSTRERLKYWLSERKKLEKKNLKKEEKRNKNKERD